MQQMTFDEQLRRAVDTLAGRLRDEITQHVHAAADDIGALTRADRSDADARAYASGHEAGRTAGLQEGRTAGFQEGRATGLQEGRTAGLQEGRTAGLQDGRIAGLQDGRIAGLQDGRTAGLQDGEDTVARLVDAMRAIDATRSLTAMLDVLVTQAAREADRAAILLVRGDRLQRWRFVGFDAGSGPHDTDEFLLHDADVVGEAVKTKGVVAADATEPLRVPSFAASSSSNESVCVPIALAGDVVAVLYADRRDANAPPQWRRRIEMLARHATRSLEALIAFKAARMLTPSPRDFAASLDESDASAEDQTAARRYARLLVSEIRLYHEEAVAAGRRERDLATRLGGEIARARTLYEQRIPSRVRHRADYFQDELVRTLANGDPALLELRS
jgi:hypothetical protein